MSSALVTDSPTDRELCDGSNMSFFFSFPPPTVVATSFINVALTQTAFQLGEPGCAKVQKWDRAGGIQGML